MHLLYLADDQLRLVERNPVSASGRYNVPSSGRQARERLLLADPMVSGIGHRDRHERQIAISVLGGVEHFARCCGHGLDLAAERLIKPGLGPEPAERLARRRWKFPERSEQPLDLAADVAS